MLDLCFEMGSVPTPPWCLCTEHAVGNAGHYCCFHISKRQLIFALWLVRKKKRIHNLYNYVVALWPEALPNHITMETSTTQSCAAVTTCHSMNHACGMTGSWEKSHVNPFMVCGEIIPPIFCEDPPSVWDWCLLSAPFYPSIVSAHY